MSEIIETTTHLQLNDYKRLEFVFSKTYVLIAEEYREDRLDDWHLNNESITFNTKVISDVIKELQRIEKLLILK